MLRIGCYIIIIISMITMNECKHYFEDSHTYQKIIQVRIIIIIFIYKHFNHLSY